MRIIFLRVVRIAHLVYQPVAGKYDFDIRKQLDCRSAKDGCGEGVEHLGKQDNSILQQRDWDGKPPRVFGSAHLIGDQMC